MSLFKKKPEYPTIPEGDYDVVLRCSICNGEEVICLKDKSTCELRDLMLISDPKDLQGFCEVNNISMNDIKKVY